MTIPVTDDRPITPSDLRFAADDAPARPDRTCPACGNRTAARSVLEVPSLVPPHPTLELVRCECCESVYFDPPGIRDFEDVDQEGTDSLRHYVEVGGGVWETVWPILVGRDRGSLLDVGCGYGFSVDFWRRTGRGDAVGIESAAYGRAGARDLGVPILDERLDRSVALAGRRFDIVYASEVIEHVGDPRGFAATLAAYVADDGELILTTPSAEYVEARHVGCALLAALSPGYHGFLLSERAFVAAVRSAGFAHVESRVEGPRQMLRASRRPLPPWRDQEAARADVLRYLGDRAADPATGATVRLAYRYRSLRDLVFLGRWAEARAVDDDLARDLAERHGTSILDPAWAAPRYRECRSLREAGRVGPHFLPGYYHLAAVVARAARNDPAGARELHRGAVAVIAACVHLGPLLYLEAIAMVRDARLDAAMLGLMMGIESDADEIALMAEDVGAPDKRNLWTSVDPSSVERMLPRVAEDTAMRKMPAAARVLANAYRRHVERRYGSAFATVDEVASAVASGAPLPPEPLFVPWFEALEAYVAGGEAAARERVLDLLRFADRHARDPGLGPALTAFARRVRKRTGIGRESVAISAKSFRIEARGR